MSISPPTNSSALVAYQSPESLIYKSQKIAEHPSLPKTTWHVEPNSAYSVTRIKTKIVDGKPVTSSTTYEVIDAVGSSYSSSMVFIIGPKGGKGKPKVMKVVGSCKHEYEIAQLWKNKTVGLMISPKAHLVDDDKELLIMHKYDGTLYERILNLTPEQKLEAICQISSGLADLHSLKINHSDIKLTNILYDKRKNRYDIIDFEYSQTPKNNIPNRRDDIEDFREVIHSILSDRKYTPQELRLNEKSISKLGYSEEVLKYIKDVATHKNYSAQAISHLFHKALEEYRNPILT